jgi:hypothetical protein
LLPFSSRAEPPSSIRIGNFLREAPCGIAWVIDDSAAFVLNTGGPYVAGTAAPDESYHSYRFEQDGANIVFQWGRVGDDVAGIISADKPATLNLTLSSGWPGWTSTFTPAQGGADGVAQSSGGQVKWSLRTSPAPTSSSASAVVIAITPDARVRFVAGLKNLPGFESVDSVLKAAREKYDAARPAASGDWGDFVGAIEDNMNNSRLYSSDNHRLAHSVSRTWADTPNGSPYFCWDSFFTANLASIDDLDTARDTIRAILSYQSPEGLVPNFGHWPGQGGASMDRSQPPVASLCAWKIHERYPDDRAFLAEIYPKLVLWHDWWPKYRDAKQDGLLEWGDSDRDFQGAQYETGWDDNLHYAGAGMRGITMNAYSVDLSSMWSMDAEYLAQIANFLGHREDAARFHAEQEAMNKRINDRLWNSDLGAYCSRFWSDAGYETPVDGAFAAGFDGEYFNNENLEGPAVGSTHDAKLDVNWDDKAPVPGVSGGDHWSARWKGAFTPPMTTTYRFIASADDGVRVFVDGKQVIDDWSVHAAHEVTGEASLTQGKTVPVVVEYFQNEQQSELHLAVKGPPPPSAMGGFLTRLTPMNFYPLLAGAPDAERTREAMKMLTDPKKFWGQYLLPTVAYDDPDYYMQEYWRGDVWGPTNYLVWQGIKRYASPAQIAEFADRNVRLFMKNWEEKGVCGENYLSTDGTQNHDPHYTWGALLDLIGIESIVDVDNRGRIVLNGAHQNHIRLTRIPILGKIYDVKVTPGETDLIRNGSVVLVAKGEIVRAAVP